MALRVWKETAGYNNINGIRRGGLVEPVPPSGRLLGKAKVERCDCLLLCFFDTCSISHVGAVYSAFGILWNFFGLLVVGISFVLRFSFVKAISK